MKINRLKRSVAIAVLAALSLPAATALAAGPSETLAKSTFQAKAIAWAPQFAYRSASLRITGPGGLVVDREFGTGKPVFDLSSVPFVADGQYSFELVFGRQPDEALEKAMARAVVGEDGSVADAGLAAKLSALRETVSGAFTVSQGQIVSPYLIEPRGGKADSLRKDIVQADDVIVQGSICAGLDCVINESFGADTIRMKENNLRIHFDDTSASAGFASNDWRIVANDQASGGASYLAFEDATAGRLVFQVRAGAPADSLFVDSSGRVGLRTSTPVLDLHARTSNTPGIRLEQDNSGGFTAQTWDVAGNEANFFIRDVTGGSKLPFRIRPGAPSSSIDIAASGNVGIGTASPELKLHVAGPAVAESLAINGGGWYQEGVIYSDANWGMIFRAKQAAPLLAQFRWASSADGEFMRIDPAGNVGIGTASPASKLHVQGDATVTGALHVFGACCGPDYVFDPSYKLASIEDQARYMWKNRHLPAVGAARTTPDGAAVVDVFAQSNGMLEELEKAHIYIEKLHREIQELKAQAETRNAEIRAELAALRERLPR